MTDDSNFVRLTGQISAPPGSRILPSGDELASWVSVEVDSCRKVKAAAVASKA